MQIILMIEDHMAQEIKQIGLEQCMKCGRLAPVLMVIKENKEMEALDNQDSVQILRAIRSFHGTGEESEIPEVIQKGAFRLYPKQRRVEVSGKEIELKNREYDLLLYLVSHADQVFTKEHLYRTLWGEDAKGDRATIIVHINRLRQKLEADPSNPRYIQTVWGSGYRFRP